VALAIFFFVSAIIDHSYDRFLRARKFDLVKAKAMLISAEQWRKEEGVDEIAK
jgi:hypothetical protein